MGERIVVGMSGGVDSSVAAGLLVERGAQVIGVTLHLWDYGAEGHRGRCCAPEDQYDARQVCDTLGVPHYTFDRRELFRASVVEPFVGDYLRGQTPSPCVRCNESVKLGPLLAIARRLGASRIATGHYARIESAPDGSIRLRTATDLARDQSYFLFASPEPSLRALDLPLGGLHKSEVREHATRLGLVTAHKPDSTDLCFVEGRDYAEWLEDRVGAEGFRAGPIETVDGRVVGTHDGIHRYTVGQRRGVGAIEGAPRYVLRVVPERAAVIVGSSEESVATHARVAEVRWLVPSPPREVTARLRYRHPGVRASVSIENDDAVLLTFAQPQRGVAPGQAAVFYDGDRVVGGGFLA